MTYIIVYEVYHDNGALDPNVFASLDAAVAYIQAIPIDDPLLPFGSDLGAIVYEVGAEALVQVDEWYQVEGYWNLPADHPVWVHSYEAYKQAEKQRVRL